ncbi:hypothetical protein [Mixta intestinalis]|jgi:hypothetical protein|uniref:Holin n=1 Tax=Mixta intestinalis TaxID=1615494 RepID=A0A6P1PZR7_9GAMM|nr:hypothetical protein [Mixta intestinalis]QHM71369.1 hypothetical protein C7M51_01655 [Mixta intestinalis]
MTMKLKLVKDWPDWWRWHSTKALVLLGLLPTVWLEMPPEWKAMIPASWLQAASFIIMLLGMFSRITRQKVPPGQQTTSEDGEVENNDTENKHQG